MESSQPTFFTQLILQLAPTVLLIVFAPISAIFYKLVIPGLLKWRRLRDELTTFSVRYANFIAFTKEVDGKKVYADKEKLTIVNEELRRLAGEITTVPNAFLYKQWIKTKLLPSETQVEDIRGALVGWANSLDEKKNGDLGREVFIEQLKLNLGLENSYSQLKEIQTQEWENARRH